MSRESELNLAILISGSGTTMDRILSEQEEGNLPGLNPVAVISSRPEAAGIQKAEKHGIPTFVVLRKGVSADVFSAKLLELLRELKVDLVSQNGWLPLTPEEVIKAFQGRCINQHPAPLDPGRGHDFGGRGMYGRAPHCARIAYLWMSGEKPWTESTVHKVTAEFDGGGLISVMEMQLPNFAYVISPEDLARRESLEELSRLTEEVQRNLLPLEHENTVAALKKIGSEKQVTEFSRETPLIPEENYPILEIAKMVAQQLYPRG